MQVKLQVELNVRVKAITSAAPAPAQHQPQLAIKTPKLFELLSFLVVQGF